MEREGTQRVINHKSQWYVEHESKYYCAIEIACSVKSQELSAGTDLQYSGIKIINNNNVCD